MPSVKCIYCGNTQETEENHPDNLATCSACNHKFPIRRVDDKPGPEDSSAPASPSAQPAKAEIPQTAVPIASSPGTVKITCPQCQFSSEVPATKIPPRVLQLNCRKCAHKFQFDGSRIRPAKELHPVLAGTGSEPQQASAKSRRQLRPLAELFADSWQHFQQRILTLIGVNLLGILLILIGFWFYSSGVNLLQKIFGDGLIAGVLAVLIGTAYSWLAIAWIAGATVCAVSDSNLGVREALGVGLQKILPFLWVFILLGIIIGGGYFAFFIPGVLFTVWFVFAQYIVAAEDSQGMEALLKSRQYVKGHGWEICGRFLVLGILLAVLGFILGLIPLIGPLLSLLLGPFAMVYQFEIYQDLKQVKGNLIFSCTTGEKAKWLLAGLAGFVLIPLLGLALIGPGMLQNLLVTGNAPTELMLTEPGPGNTGAMFKPAQGIEQSTALIYIYAINYQGSVRLNGESIYDIPGDRDVSYNYTGSIDLHRGSNRFEVDYTALPEPWMTELRIKVYQMDWDSDAETVLGEWLISDPSGTRQIVFEIPDEP